jgi:FtsP/CotA-like multicopper oxidase with cupredoxin domain
MPALALAILAIAATPSFAQGNWVALEAVASMPDGNVIPMWGFFEDTGQPCTDVPAWEVGPALTASPGGTVTVNLRNCLGAPTSVFIPGQLKATSPVTFTDGEGRTRVRSFDAETAAGGSGTYSWTGVKEGTYLYHSGTHPQVQVQMGLYGALTVGNYGITNEATLIYSEIDPDLHAAVDDGSYGTTGPTSTFDYKPAYFLINGAAYPDTMDIVIGTGTDVLLRFVNAGLKTHVPTLEGGLYMDLIAEDGNLYPFPQTQYGVELSAAKTIDARLNAGTDGRYALYDRALNLTNGLDTGGGMLTYIDAGPVIGAPTAVDDAYATDEGVPLVVSAALGVLLNDTGGAAAAVLVSGPSAGTLSGGLAADGSFTYTPTGNFNGTDTFTYRANDGLGGPNSNVATVRITVNAVNNAPVAIDDFDTTPLNTPVTTDVVANDMDVDGNLDPTSVTVQTMPAFGMAVSNGDGTITYDPGLIGNFGPVSFVYEVCDTGDDGLGTNALCDTATVDVTVEATPPANVPPFANDDFAEVVRNSDVTFPANTFSVTANDIDPDGSIDVTTVVITTGAKTQRNGTVVENGDGTVTYTPKKGFRGTDTFKYTVNDNAGATSNEATVRVNVVKP